MKPKLNNRGIGLLFFGKILLIIIIGTVYFLILTPLGFLLKMTGKDLLKIKFSNKTNSYWIKRKKDLSSMSKQF